MTKIPGVYKLGKALIENLEALEHVWDQTPDKLLQTDANTHRIRVALMDAARKSDHIGLFFAIGGLMKTYPAEVTSDTAT